MGLHGGRDNLHLVYDAASVEPSSDRDQPGAHHGVFGFYTSCHRYLDKLLEYLLVAAGRP